MVSVVSVVYGVMHALPIMIAGALYGTKRAVWIACAVMVAVALALGQLAYAWIDLIGVAAGTAIALYQLHKAGRSKPAP